MFGRKTAPDVIPSTRMGSRLQETVPGKLFGSRPSVSFDHHVGDADQRGREGEAEGVGGLEADEQLERRDLLDRQISRLFALEHTSGIDASLTVRLREIASVAHQAPAMGKSRDWVIAGTAWRTASAASCRLRFAK